MVVVTAGEQVSKNIFDILVNMTCSQGNEEQDDNVRTEQIQNGIYPDY